MKIEERQIIMLTDFGSHIYGTNLPTSDTDIKGVLLPTASEILLQRTPKSYQHKTKDDPNARNTPDDVDTEIFGLQTYLKLLMEGQTVSLDMLFTPKSFYKIEAKPWWNFVLENKSKFLHAQASSFVGYCMTQAAKYGLKGSRVNAVRTTLEWLSSKKDHSKLGEHFSDGLPEELKKEHIAIVMCRAPNGGQEPHLEVCNRKVPFHALVKYTREVFQRIFDEYGARALLAEKNEGVDWKALMHAVRVAREAEELLLTSNITFPRPEKDLLLAIRKGEMPYKEVAALIEEGLIRVNEAKAKSVLPEKPNHKFVEALVEAAHEEIVLSSTKA